MSIIILNTIVVLIWTGFFVLNLWLWQSSSLVPEEDAREIASDADQHHGEIRET